MESLINNFEEFNGILKNYLILVIFLFLLLVFFGIKIIQNTSISKEKKFIRIFFSFFIFLTLTRFLYLNEIPFLVDGDSSRIALDSLSLWKNKSSIFTTGWGSYQGMVFFLQGFFLRIFNQRIFGLRAFSALSGILSILVVYLLSHEVFDLKAGFLSALFLSVLPIFWIFSRMGTDFVLTTLFLPLILYLVILSLKKGMVILILAGIVLGFSQYFYHSVRLIPPVCLFSFLYLAKKKWPVKKVIFGAFCLIVSSIIIYWPMINYYFKNPEIFSSRFNQIGIFKKGWLKEEMRTTPIKRIIKRQILDPFSVFFKETEAPMMHFHFRHYLPFIGSILFILGILKMIKERKPESFIFFIWLLGGIILGGVLTIDSPQDSRYLILFPVVSIFMGKGAEWVLSFKFNKNREGIIMGVILILYGANCFKEFYDHELIQSIKNGGNTLIATLAGRYLQKERYIGPIYFLGNDYMYYNAVPTLPFLTGISGEDIEQPLSIEGEGLLKKQAVFIILPGRYNELETLKKINPSGNIKKFQNFFGQTLFLLYEI